MAPAAQTAKKSKKPSPQSPAPKSRKKPGTKTGRGKKAKVLRLEDYLPESERLEVLRRAARRLDEVEQTQEVLKAVQRLAEATTRVGGQLQERLTGLEETAEERIETARERLLALSAVQSFQEMTGRMSDRALEELDELLDQVGLMRRALHEEEIALLKKKHQAARKAAESRAKKVAERDAKAELKKKAAAGGSAV